MDNNIFDLKSGEHLSDYAKHIPTNPGQYLIKAPTGVGKTYHQVREAQKAGVYVIFPIKSIVAQQKEEAKRDGLKTDNIIQLEKFLKVPDCNINGVLFDECQWIYEGGFRKSIEELHKKLTRLSEKVPVYYFSGTHDAVFDPTWFQAEQVFEFTKRNEKALVRYELNITGKGIIDRRKADILPVLKREIELARQRGTCVLFFLDSEASLTQLAEALKKDGYKAEVFTSKMSVKNRPTSVNYLFETSTIANSGADIILSTSGLEAGINVNDDVTIVSVPAYEGKLVQRFGRARNGGRYVLIHGVGEEDKRLKPKKVSIASDESERYEVGYNDYARNKCTFDDKAHRTACDNYANYAWISRQYNFTADVRTSLATRGYNTDHVDAEAYEFEVVADREIFRDVTKKMIREAIKAVCGNNPKVEDIKSSSDAIAAQVVTDKITLSVAKVFVNRAIEVIDRIHLLQVSDDALIIKNAADVFADINADSINMLVTIEYNPDFEKKAREMRDELAGEKITSDTVDECANDYWKYVCSDRLSESSLWLSADMQNSRSKLFKLLVGVGNDGVVRKGREKKKKAWWKDALKTPVENKKYSLFKSIASGAGTTMEQVHEASGLTRSQLISKYTLKTFEQALSSGFYETSSIDADVNWGV